MLPICFPTWKCQPSRCPLLICFHFISFYCPPPTFPPHQSEAVTCALQNEYKRLPICPSSDTGRCLSSFSFLRLYPFIYSLSIHSISPDPVLPFTPCAIFFLQKSQLSTSNFSMSLQVRYYPIFSMEASIPLVTNIRSLLCRPIYTVLTAPSTTECQVCCLHSVSDFFLPYLTRSLSRTRWLRCQSPLRYWRPVYGVLV